jgi:hypothetical protein
MCTKISQGRNRSVKCNKQPDFQSITRQHCLRHVVQRKKNVRWRKKEEYEEEQILFAVSKMIRIFQENVIIDKLWTRKMAQETQELIVQQYNWVGMKIIENTV